jgi:alpha-L-fucosidase 2
MRASEILCVDQTFRRDLIKLSSRLRPTLIATDGRIREWPEYLESVEPEPHHRHTSHLYGLYPSCQINHEKHPDLAKACDTTLDARGPPGTGWAAAWRLNLFARLRDGRKAWQMLMTLLSDMTYPNLFDVHPPQNKNYSMGTFQIDGNLGGAAGIIEMLVQSLEDTDDIILLPALPAELSSGSLRGVRLRGCWTIDIEWVNGKLVRVTLVSDLTGSRRVRYKGHSRIVHLERGDRATLVGEELSIATETL